jgi:DNA invertase Pin-like site-specific DNA recombinase
MQVAIGYLRVSTQEQGRSGWGLEAQRREIDAFAQREKFSIRCYASIASRTGPSFTSAEALAFRPLLTYFVEKLLNGAVISKS